YQSVYRLVKREDIVLQPDIAKLTAVQLEEAQGLLDTGMSQRQVAKQFGVSHETLRRSLKRVKR
ncbi:MAG: helix-turn-helix domain-containing protein, partial [Ktedonobacteraceae bacterium]